MLMKNLAAVAALSLMAAPVAAQSTAASALSPVRAGATTADENDLMGGGLWAALIGIALVAAFILVVIEDDDVDLPDSP